MGPAFQIQVKIPTSTKNRDTRSNRNSLLECLRRNLRHMLTDSNNLKWLHFSQKSQEFPRWSTKFIPFMQTKGFYKTARQFFRKTFNDQQAARDAQQKEYTIRVEQRENRKNTVWCHLALTLDSTTLITIRQESVNAH